LNDLRISLAFIFGLANASLDDPESGLDAAAVERIRNPTQHQHFLDDDLDLKAAVKLSTLNCRMRRRTMNQRAKF
ncbi:hypothetical protein BDR06DRAFT_898236, partial [Suillus hirtellus]